MGGSRGKYHMVHIELSVGWISSRHKFSISVLSHSAIDFRLLCYLSYLLEWIFSIQYSSPNLKICQVIWIAMIIFQETDFSVELLNLSKGHIARLKSYMYFSMTKAISYCFKIFFHVDFTFRLEN